MADDDTNKLPAIVGYQSETPLYRTPAERLQEAGTKFAEESKTRGRIFILNPFQMQNLMLDNVDVIIDSRFWNTEQNAYTNISMSESVRLILDGHVFTAADIRDGKMPGLSGRPINIKANFYAPK